MRQFLNTFNPSKSGGLLYLCKFQGLAMAHSRWFDFSDKTGIEISLRQRIRRFDQNFDEKSHLKNMNSPIQHDFEIPPVKDDDLTSEEKIKDWFRNPDLLYLNYDQNTLEVDRIVSCSEMFDIIHPKKAGKILSKWSDSILRVLQILINFKYQGVCLFIFGTGFSIPFRIQKSFS